MPAAERLPDPADEALQRAIDKVCSLRQGDVGVLEAIALGPRAIPALRRILFSPEPSGLFQPRRQAVEALAGLGAEDVLLDFLAHPPDSAEPVQRAGDEAVMNAAARSLRRHDAPGLYRLLLRLVHERKLPGAIEALAQHGRLESLPAFIDALGDDLAQPAAETALAGFGLSAADALLGAACRREGAFGQEAESSKRRRFSALRLLRQLGDAIGEKAAMILPLLSDADPRIVAAAGDICLGLAPPEQRAAAARRLIASLPSAELSATEAIESCLATHAALLREVLREAAGSGPPALYDLSPTARAQRLLLHVMAKAGL